MTLSFYTFAQKFILRKLSKASLVEEFFTNKDYTIQFWDTKTDKPAILLLNGFGASTEFQWYKQVEILSKRYRVVLVNLLYFGQSKGNHEAKFKIEHQVQSVQELVTFLNINIISIMGISYGGLIAAEYAHKNKSSIDKLIMVNAPIKYLTVDHLESSVIKYGASSIEDFFAPQDYIGLKKQFKAAYYIAPFLPIFMLKAFHKNMCKPYLENWKSLIHNLRNEVDFLSQRDYSFPDKTFMIWGEQDKIIPMTIGQQLQIDSPTLKLYPIKNAGHLPNIERARAFNKQLLEIIN